MNRRANSLRAQAMKYSITWFDFLICMVLFIGLLRGKKRGMSEELLSLIQWICIVFVAGKIYEPFSIFISAQLRISALFANMTAYLLVVIGIKFLFLAVKKFAGEKLTGSDVFGPLEYYLGMLAGMLRWFCMFFVGLCLFNSRLVTDAELAALVKQDKDVYGSSFFPRYGTIQRDIFKQSYSGPMIQTNLGFLMIKQAPYEDLMAKRVEVGRQRERDLNELIDKKR